MVVPRGKEARGSKGKGGQIYDDGRFDFRWLAHMQYTDDGS